MDASEGFETVPPDARAPRGRRVEAEAEALIRRHLRGQLSRDRIHDVEGLAEDARVFLDPSDARHRHGGRGETLHDLRLRGQVVLGEDTELGRREARDEAFDASPAVGEIGHLEQQRVVGEAGLRPRELGDRQVLRLRHTALEPGRQAVAESGRCPLPG